MITIGILGGVASGKSSVAHMLAELGAEILDADRTGHEVLNDKATHEFIRHRFGPDVLATDGSVDRHRVAELVFGDSPASAANRKALEAFLHPAIKQRLAEEAQQLVDAGCQVVVLDAPLLLEAGWHEQCDLLVFVDTPPEARLRFAQQRGWDADELESREMAQADLHDKRQHANISFTNSGSLGELREKVREFWQQQIAPRLQDG